MLGRSDFCTFRPDDPTFCCRTTNCIASSDHFKNCTRPLNGTPTNLCKQGWNGWDGTLPRRIIRARRLVSFAQIRELSRRSRKPWKVFTCVSVPFLSILAAKFLPSWHHIQCYYHHAFLPALFSHGRLLAIFSLEVARHTTRVENYPARILFSHLVAIDELVAAG